MMPGNVNRAADGRAKLILLEGSYADQRVAGIEGCVAHKFPKRSVIADVPDFVTTLTMPPITPPNDASSLCDCTLNS